MDSVLQETTKKPLGCEKAMFPVVFGIILLVISITPSLKPLVNILFSIVVGSHSFLGDGIYFLSYAGMSIYVFIVKYFVAISLLSSLGIFAYIQSESLFRGEILRK